MESAHAAGNGCASFCGGGQVSIPKKNEPVLTMPQALILIIAAMTKEPEKISKALRDVTYYQKNNTKAYRSHRKKRLQISA